MSFQAYLDNIEEKTGLTPRQFIELANGRGFGPSTKATPIVEWLKADYDLGRGHAMALGPRHHQGRGHRRQARRHHRRTPRRIRHPLARRQGHPTDVTYPEQVHDRAHGQLTTSVR